MTTPHAATLPAASTAQDPHLRKTVIASVAGNAMEWYDFFVYGTAAALVFGKLFFPPGSDPLVGTLGAFAAFAIGFIARPFGGILFGHIGDRFGRKLSLVWTLSIMGAATFAIGLLANSSRVSCLRRRRSARRLVSQLTKHHPTAMQLLYSLVQ